MLYAMLCIIYYKLKTIYKGGFNSVTHNYLNLFTFNALQVR